jgi:hypothetical protein
MFNQYFSKWNILIYIAIYPSILTFISFSQHRLPNLKCSEEDCLADFVLQRDLRMKYPGDCSSEFQSVMQILTKCMLRWDTKRCYYFVIMADWRLGSNVQKLGVCCPILCPNTLRTIPCQTNRHGPVVPAIAPTNIVHGQNKKIGETNAGETPTCNKQMLEKCQHALSIIFSY